MQQINNIKDLSLHDTEVLNITINNNTVKIYMEYAEHWELMDYKKRILLELNLL